MEKALSIYAWYDVFRILEPEPCMLEMEQVLIVGVALAENEEQAKRLVSEVLGWTPVVWGICHKWPMNVPQASVTISKEWG
jgi:hypothetical protein